MKKNKIGIITFPIGEANITPFQNLIKIIREISHDYSIVLPLVPGINFQFDEKSKITYLKYVSFPRSLQRIFSYLLLQVKCGLNIKKQKECDKWIFYIGDDLIIPNLLAKILKKQTLLIMGGYYEIEVKNKGNFIDKFGIPLKRINLLFFNNIILYSPQLITSWHLTPYRHKILIAHEHFLDFTTFTVTTPYPDRPPLIGYIGRLSAEKGVQHFVQAFPAIFSEHQDLRVLIGGDGQLKDNIKASLEVQKITDRVDLPGWISHDDLPKYLNQLRLLVLPSYTEGLPNIMLEAMACGTPVLATPVGAIPDVIRDGETGFIMEDNSPECIARNVMRALTHPDLEGIAEQGRRYVEGEFTFEKAVERWRGILENFN